MTMIIVTITESADNHSPMFCTVDFTVSYDGINEEAIGSQVIFDNESAVRELFEDSTCHVVEY